MKNNKVHSTKKKHSQKEKLGSHDFKCDKCNKVHTKSVYVIAQCSMNVELIFTCDCGHQTEL